MHSPKEMKNNISQLLSSTFGRYEPIQTDPKCDTIQIHTDGESVYSEINKQAVAPNC